VLAEQRESGRRLARILAERHLLDEERLTRAVAAKLGIEAVAVKDVRVHERVLALVPATVAVAHGVLPIAVKRTQQTEVVFLVMADPLDITAISEVQRVTNRQVRVLIAKASEVDLALSQHYGSTPPATATPIPPHATPPSTLALPPSSGRPEDAPTASERPGSVSTRFSQIDGRADRSSYDDTRASEWDRSVREWEGAAYTPKTDDLEQERLGVAGTPKEVQDDDAEPVTTSGALDADWSSAVPYPPDVSVSDAVTNFDGSVDLQLPDPRAATTLESHAPQRSVIATTMEIPVAWEDDSHPFAGPGLSDVRVGLDRTSIIPAADLGRAEFQPPPLRTPARGTGIIGSGDIPMSAAEVEARKVRPDDVPDLDIARGIDEDSLEPISDRDVVPLDFEAATTRPTPTSTPTSDSARIPVIEPSRLQNLIDEADLSQEDTGADEQPLPEAVTPDRFPEVATAVRPMPAEPSRPTLGPVRKQASTEATRHATSLVASLRSGQSLSSAQRAELVLALGRLLLDKGMITEAELLRALLE
ncbi:MAG: hypothetical protein AAF449_22950, partial [Myxococcota bacterium]